ncbi:Uncharacterised protein [Raoultella ornithinolytica]|nr:Uncharacterised protein [Raoultella ornithinolytica]
MRIDQRKIDWYEALMDAEHHRQQEQTGEHRGAKRVAVEMEEQPRHPGKQPAADGHNHRKGHRAHNQQSDCRGQDHIEVGRHHAAYLLFHPRAENRGNQHADNVAARVDAVTEEGGDAGEEPAGGFGVIAEDEQRRDNGAVDSGTAKRFLRVIANQDAQEGEHPLAEDFHVAD